VNLKKEVIDTCFAVIKGKMDELKSQINELMEDAESDSKSSAGDKHETARAMMQLEQEKLNRQLAELIKQEEALQMIRNEEKHDTVRQGSIVETDKGFIFLAIPLGKIQIAKKDFMVISPASPFAKVIIGQKPKATVEINNSKYKILSLQ
jgi:transcription elongation GreA/GreB family factor